jgi:nucleoside-diphosphate-sugar epimerase
MRVLVTGANGCIGAWVVKGLLDRGIDVLVYDADPNPARLRLIAPEEQVRKLRIETGRIEDTDRVKALVTDGITHVIHLAAVLIPYCQANPVSGAMVNVIGTLNVFEAARDAGRPVRVVYASSSAVWGPEEAYGGGKLSEDDAPKPATHYGIFKQANEANARVFYDTNGISSVGLRPWSVYGVGRDSGLTADPTLAIRAVAENQSFRIRLTGHMDLQYVEDVAESFIGSMLATFEGAHVFNLEGSATRMEDFIRVLDRIHPGAADLISASGPQVPVAWRMDGSRIRSMVPNLPNTPLETGVRQTLEIFKKLGRENRLSA